MTSFAIYFQNLVMFWKDYLDLKPTLSKQNQINSLHWEKIVKYRLFFFFVIFEYLLLELRVCFEQPTISGRPFVLGKSSGHRKKTQNKKLIIWRGLRNPVITYFRRLTNFTSMFRLHIPWERKKNLWFSDVFKGYRVSKWIK